MKKQSGRAETGTSRRRGRVLAASATAAALVLAIFFAASEHSRASGEAEQNTRRAATLAADENLPVQIDVRGGTPRGLDARNLTAVQGRALTSLQNAVGVNLNVRYNGLTATPMFISNPSGYLTAPSAAPAEQIARDFIGQWREAFRFDQATLNNLKLQSRAVSPEGITVLLFQQQANGIPVYHGEVLVNVNRAGQIMTVGGDSFPRLQVTNSAAIDAATAVSNAASSLGVSGFTPQSLGTARILTTYGDLNPEYAAGQKFAHNVFTDDIEVQTVVFPLGDTGRVAYKFNLTSPLYHNIIWMNIVDAQTGEILKRTSLTSYFGEPGGGTSIPRKGSFRPDVQNMIESNNATGTARGKVFDTVPTTLSKVGGTGRAVRTGTTPANYMVARPAYDVDATLTEPFRYSIVAARNEDPLPFLSPLTTPIQAAQPLTPGLLGQLMRGFPDAANPNASSPFGWFYLPTGSNGAEITQGSATTAPTKFAGYTMSDEAKARNLAANSPGGNGDQPFSADLTALGSTVTLADGRTLNSVYQSRYTEGNNVIVSDDRANDNGGTRGIRGYAANRQFSADYFDYYANYEFLGPDASGGGTGSTTPVTYPSSSNSDVYPDTTNLFYFNNLEHDYLYSIGFTEPFWNFQNDNFGKGGAGSDAIDAEVQDGSGTDNANMGTPAEGANPRMQMYLFTDGGFRRSDGDLDWDVVAHEHYHGVSNRSAAKGGDSCLGTPLVGESGGMGEGWSDAIATSMSDDDSEGEYVTGQFDNAIRRLPYTNYRYSYGSLAGATLNVRKNTNTQVIGPDVALGGIPFEVHDVGEVWAATLWDMRELMIVKQKVNNSYPGIFFDGAKRTGSGTMFYVGDRQVQSVDANHPINYRQTFLTDNGGATAHIGSAAPTLNATRGDITRPGALATENAANPQRNGPLATAVARGARLADTITLRGLQLAVCNPTFIDMRDSMLAADREITGGENQAIIQRAFASHGVGVNATSTGKTNGTAQQGGPGVVVEDFTVSTDVTACELNGPLPAPTFTLANAAANSVTVTIVPVTGATSYVIARSTSPNGPFTTIATQAGTTYTDTDGGNGLVVGQTYYYQVHSARNASCVGTGSINSITVTVGAPLSPAPVFAGLGKVDDPRTGTALILSWSPASSTNQGANIVYDIYRVINVAADTDLIAPTFTPNQIPVATAGGNLLKTGVTGTSYTDTGLTLGQQYYYIVRARDTNANKVDTLNVGNTVTQLNAPTSNRASAMAPFTLETFETAAASARFTPALTESAAPDRSMAAFERTTGDLGAGTTSLNEKGDEQSDATSATTGLMYAGDFDPLNSGMGGPSDFAVTIQPTLALLNRTSFLEFDHRYATEGTFDGNNIEIVLGAPLLPVTPSPNNTTTFDLNDFIVQNPYNGNLNGTLEGAAMGSVLMGRRSFTGSRPLTHVRVAIGDFRAGGVKNPQGLPVYIRFHSTSDTGTFVDGWYVDNVVVNNFDAAVNIESDVQMRPSGDGVIDADDIQQVRRFSVGLDMPYQGNEFQRADASPRSTAGDGFLDADDVQQARRYAVATDANQATGGPAAAAGKPSGTGGKSTADRSNRIKEIIGDDSSTNNKSRIQPAFRIDNQIIGAGQTITVPVRVDATGDEAGYTFGLSYDASKLTNPIVSIGKAGGDVVSNVNNPGQIGFSVTSFSGGKIAAGTSQVLVNVQFTVAGNAPAGIAPIAFNSELTRQKAAGVDPSTPIIQPTYTDGALTISPVSSETSSLTGRVMNARGISLSRVTMTISNAKGETRTTVTNAFGYFNFDHLAAGETYLIAAKAKGYTFDPSSQNVTANGDLAKIEFIGR